MAQNRILAVVLLVSVAVANGYQYCSPNDCRAEVNALLNNPGSLCQSTKPVEEAILKCIRRDSGIECPRNVREQMKPVAQNVQEVVAQQCPSRAARAGECQLFQMIGCLSDFAAVLAAPNLFPLNDMEEFCRDLQQLTDALGRCIDCVGQYFDAWGTVRLDVQFATNVSKVLVNGGCTCAANITRRVNQINNNSTCRFVQDVSGIAKTIASDCIVPAINSVATFDWLTMTNNLLNTVLTIAQNACLFFNGAPAVSSSTFVILGALLATVVFSFKSNNLL